MLLTPWLAALQIRLHAHGAPDAGVELPCGCLPPGWSVCCGRRALSLLRQQFVPAVVPVRVSREHHWRARQRLS